MTLFCQSCVVLLHVWHLTGIRQKLVGIAILLDRGQRDGAIFLEFCWEGSRQLQYWAHHRFFFKFETKNVSWIRFEQNWNVSTENLSIHGDCHHSFATWCNSSAKNRQFPLPPIIHWNLRPDCILPLASVIDSIYVIPTIGANAISVLLFYMHSMALVTIYLFILCVMCF